MGTYKIKDGVLESYYVDENDNGKTVVPKGVVKIGHSAFLGEDNLGTVYLPDGVKIIGDSAFADCYGLTEVILPSSVQRIESEAFYSNDMQQITLPRGLKYLGWGALGNCLILKKINYLGTVAEFKKIELEEPIFNMSNATKTITCTDGKVTLRDY